MVALLPSSQMSDQIDAAIAQLETIGGGALEFPGGDTAITRPIQLSSLVPIWLTGCGGRIFAAEAMDVMVQGPPATTYISGGGIEKLILDGMGIADNLYLDGAHRFTVRAVEFKNGVLQNVTVGVAGQGSSAFENKFRDFTIENTITLYTAGSQPQFGLKIYGSDNHFNSFEVKNISDSHIWVGPLANNTTMSGAHPYAYSSRANDTVNWTAKYGFYLSGITKLSDFNIDTTGTVAGVEIATDGCVVKGATAVFGQGVSNDQIGIHINPSLACVLVQGNNLSAYHDPTKSIVWDTPHVANSVVLNNTPYNPAK